MPERRPSRGALRRRRSPFAETTAETTARTIAKTSTGRPFAKTSAGPFAKTSAGPFASTSAGPTANPSATPLAESTASTFANPSAGPIAASFATSFAAAFALAFALGTFGCGPGSATTAGDSSKAHAKPTAAQAEPAHALPDGQGPDDAAPLAAPERLPTPTCDAASAPLHALRQAAAGTIAEPGDLRGIAALLRAIDEELGGERGSELCDELGVQAGDHSSDHAGDLDSARAGDKPAGPASDKPGGEASELASAKAKPPSVDTLARVNALVALWFRDQLRRAVEVEVEAERNLAWARAECSWALLAADPSLMSSLDEERLGEIVRERLLAGRAVLLATDAQFREGWDRVVFPARQAIEKRLFTAAHRTLLREAKVARANADEGAAGRARAAFLLLRDRLQDKNSPAIAPIEAMLAGPPAAIDLPMLTDALAITFAKRSRKYCSEVVSSPELVGQAAGLSSVTEGMTYSRLILPDMSARLSDAGFSGDTYLQSWDALLEEVDSGHDAGEIRRLSDELVRWNCAYQEALGIAECTWNRDEVAKPAGSAT